DGGGVRNREGAIHRQPASRPVALRDGGAVELAFSGFARPLGAAVLRAVDAGYLLLPGGDARKRREAAGQPPAHSGSRVGVSRPGHAHAADRWRRGGGDRRLVPVALASARPTLA